MQTINKKNGFSLVELVAVIGVLALIMTVMLVNFNRMRSQSRDNARVNDAKQIQAALELYYNRNNSYPTSITPGQTMVANGVTYLDPVGNNPAPKNDGNCGNNEYTYAPVVDNSNYVVNFCLGNTTSQASRGANLISKNGLNTAPGLVAWWKLEEGGGKYVNDTTGNDNACNVSDGSKIDYFWTDLGNCKTGGCGQFDGTNDLYVECGIRDDFAVNSGSISLWFNIRYQINPPYDFDIIQISSLGSDSNVGLRLESNEIKLTGYKDYSRIIDLSIPDIQNNVWYYAVGTWDVNAAKLYIKGPDKDSLANIDEDKRLNFSNGKAEMKIGSKVSGVGENFDGYLDDVRLYNRALSATEVQAIYDSLK